MTQDDAVLLLRENIRQMQEAFQWLKRSVLQCQNIDLDQEITAEDFDKLENLCSRFGRTVDLVTNKIFRSIDKVELEEGGTLIDVVNRAEKRGLINSANEIREMKDLRNQIVHEYLAKALIPLLRDINQNQPVLFQIQENILTYCRQKFELEYE